MAAKKGRFRDLVTLTCLLVLVFASCIVWTPSILDNNSAIQQTGMHNQEEEYMVPADTNARYKVLDVIFEFQRLSSGGSGPACLSMVFDYYGAYLPQLTIEEVLFAEPYSQETHEECFLRAARYDEYEGREYGFEANVSYLSSLTREQRDDYLKSYVDREIPLVIVTRFSPTTYLPHFRVLTGYDERTDTFYLHDPWIEAPYSGPYTVMSTDPTEWLGEKWANQNYMVIDIRPLHLTVEIDGTPNVGGSEFELNCTIDPDAVALPTDITVELDIPAGYSLVSGTASTVLNGVSGITSCSWTLQSSSSPSSEDCIQVLATTLKSGALIGGLEDIYPCHPSPPEISRPMVPQHAGYVPCRFNFSSTITSSEDFTAEVVYFARTNQATSTYRRIDTGFNEQYINLTLGIFDPEEPVLTWIEVVTAYGTFHSEISVFLTRTTTDIKVLFMMDHDYGANYHYIRPILEGYGWQVNVTGLAEVLTPCDYQSSAMTLTVDFLISEIEDITEYDCISIMPGEFHSLLLNSPAALALINDALDAGLIVSAWCRAVRVLAAADVINGKHVTGHADYQAIYEAAGATFHELVPPIIDGNIVTGVRSRFYRTEMCEAIATALGVFEEYPPIISHTAISPDSIMPGDEIEISTQANDESGVSFVEVEVYGLNESGHRIDEIPIVDISLNGSAPLPIFSGTIGELDEGLYSIEIKATDTFGNPAYEIHEIRVGLEPTTTTATTATTTTTDDLPLNTTALAIIGGGAVIGISVIAVVLWSRKTPS